MNVSMELYETTAIYGSHIKLESSLDRIRNLVVEHSYFDHYIIIPNLVGNFILDP